jgi:hypothetical protein
MTLRILESGARLTVMIRMFSSNIILIDTGHMTAIIAHTYSYTSVCLLLRLQHLFGEVSVGGSESGQSVYGRKRERAKCLWEEARVGEVSVGGSESGQSVCGRKREWTKCLWEEARVGKVSVGGSVSGQSVCGRKREWAKPN